MRQIGKRDEKVALTQAHESPWQHLGLAPGFLELIHGQGRAWAREYEEAPR